LAMERWSLISGLGEAGAASQGDAFCG